MNPTTLVCDHDPRVAAATAAALGDGTPCSGWEELRTHLDAAPGETVVVLGPTVDEPGALQLAGYLRAHRPLSAVVLVRDRIDARLLDEAMRAGLSEVVGQHDPVRLREAVARAHQALDVLAHSLGEAGPLGPTAGEGPAGAAGPRPRGRRGRVITVFSAKGGCGKTTLATNLAFALAEGGARSVCLVDLDLSFGDVAVALQLYPAHTFADAVPIAATLDHSALNNLLTQHSPGLSALVAPMEPGGAEGIPASLVTNVLTLLRESHDLVVVDTPSAIDDRVLAAFDNSDLLALLATLDIPALKNLKLTLETLDLLNHPRERRRVVLNRADSKVGLTVPEVTKTLGTSIALQIPSSREVPASVNRGVPIVLDQPRHPVSLAITEFAERIAGSARIPQGRTGSPAHPATVTDRLRQRLRIR